MKKLIIILFTVLLLLGCGDEGRPTPQGQKKKDPHKPMAWGKKHVIYIFADDAVWQGAENQLRRTLEREYFTTENEKYFQIKRVPFADLEQFYKYNNLIFMGDLSSESKVNSYIKSVISARIKAEVEENLVGIYPVENLWANDQYVLFLLGSTADNLLKLNYLHLNETFELFRTKLLERFRSQLYAGEIHQASAFADFSWKIDLPLKYQTYKKDEPNNFVSYLARLRDKPDRYLSLYSESAPENIVDKEWIIEKRAELAWEYYDEDEYVKDNLRSRKYEIAGYSGWRIDGTWMNQKYTAGGAFQSFAFYDEQTQRAYLIDNSVYYPEGFKLDALIELELISETFRTK
ncbi:MAG: DUF4837 family protein [Candidatus Cloacimonadales bacterium]